MEIFPGYHEAYLLFRQPRMIPDHLPCYSQAYDGPPLVLLGLSLIALLYRLGGLGQVAPDILMLLFHSFSSLAFFRAFFPSIIPIDDMMTAPIKDMNIMQHPKSMTCAFMLLTS